MGDTEIPKNKVALIGYGIGGRFFHAPIITATTGLELTAIITGNADRASEARAEYPGAQVVGSAAELFSNPSDVELVVISTPNRSHVPLARAALEAGLHVVVDKPMAPTSAEARSLVDEAQRRGLILTVYHNRRFDGDFLTLQRLLSENALGDVHRFESRFERWRPTPKGGWRESADPLEVGGLLFDLGPHVVDQALVLFGPVGRVYAEIDTRRKNAGVDDDLFIALEHLSGVRSHLWISALTAQLGPRFRVLGNRAAFTKYGMDPQEEALRRGERPGKEDWGREPPERWGNLGAADDLRTIPSEAGNYPAFYAGVLAAIRDGAAPPVNPRDAITSLQIIEAARRSAVDRTVISL